MNFHQKDGIGDKLMNCRQSVTQIAASLVTHSKRRHKLKSRTEYLILTNKLAFTLSYDG